MNVIHRFLASSALIFLLCTTVCNAQQQGEPKREMSYDEIAAKQVEDMIDRYKLDDYQAFRIDTLLQHYVPVYNEELKKVKASGASQIQSYQRVVDYWGDFFDSQYEQIFTPEQWKQYLKSAAGREKKKRDKRLAAGLPQAD